MADQPISEQSLFLAAVEKPPGAERAAYLDAASMGQPELRTQVEALLAAHERLPAGGATTQDNLALDASLMFIASGTVIGRYKILEPIGEGGFGTVFMAEQIRPVQRRVALKIIKPGMDTKQVIARFEAEQQALALMDHPNIAKVFDAGVTDGGRAYFVMELVKGLPITAYCDEHRIPPRQRLELFIQVCEAVQHAHQKAIIHRDLKPRNVLIALYDGKPVPKVIDFGVAKAIGQRLTEATMFTGFGDVVGTPQYMSPEQAELNQIDVDTRSDIYSLGVLLYELLTGTTPLEARRLKESALLEVLRVIREEEPPRPSTRLTITAAAELPGIAARRGLEPKALSGIVKGDLDWIVMKALEKDRRRRYETATALAADIERHFTGEPVVAAPPGRLYSVRKYIWRHRAAVLTGTALAGLLVAGMIGTTWGMFQAWQATARETAQRKTAELRAEQLQRVSRFQASQLAHIQPAHMGTGIRERILSRFQRELVRHGLSESAIDESLGELDGALSRVNFTNVAMETLEEYVFERALRTIDQDFADQPLLQAQLLQTTADTMHTLGLLARATGPQLKALEIRRNELGNDDPATLESMRMLGDLLRANGRYRDALETMREVVAVGKRTLGSHHPDTLRSLKKLAYILVHADDHDEAVRVVQDALEGCRRVFGDKDPETSEAYAIKGMMLRCGAGRYQEGAGCLRTAFEGLRDSLGDEHPATLQTQLNLGWAVLWLGEVKEAEALNQEAYATSLRALGDDHPNTLFGLDNMGLVRVAQGRLDEAVEYHRRALEGRRRVLGEQHTETLRSMWHLGRALWKARGAAEAEPLFREALDGPKDVFPWGKWLRPYVLIELADILEETGRLEESERLKAEAAALVRGFAFQPWGCSTFAVVMVSNAQTLQAMKRFAEAESRLLEAHAFLDGKPGPVRAWAHAVKSPDDYTSEAVIRRLVELYDAWSAAEPEFAAEIRAKAAPWRAKLHVADDRDG